MHKRGWKIIWIILIIGGVIWLGITAYSWFIYTDWQTMEGGFAQLLGESLDKVVQIIGSIVAIGVGILGFSKGSNKREITLAEKPLQKVTLEELDRRFKYDGSKVTYVDRGITSNKTMNNHGKIVITGPMKTGKTREAVQIIHEMVERKEVSEDCIYRINSGYSINLEERILSHQVGVDFDRPVLLFIDDLPHHYKKTQLDWLKGLIQALKRCKELWVVATARIDQLDAAHCEWFKQMRIKELSIKKFKNDQFIELVKNCAAVFDLTIEDAALYVFLRNKERNPEHILICMQLLKSQGITVITEENADEISKQTLADIWAKTKREILEDFPSVKYLLEALACYYNLNIATSDYFIIHLAMFLWRKDKDTGNPEKKRLRQLQTAFEYLEKDVIVKQDDRITIADYKVESLIKTSKAEKKVEQFLYSHRKLFHRRFLMRFYPQHSQHAELFCSFSGHYYFQGNKGKSISVLKKAIPLQPSSFYYNILGVRLKKDGRKAEAEGMYRKAIEKDAGYAKAYYNLGLLLRQDGRIAEAEEMYHNAIEKDAGYAKAYYNLACLRSLDHDAEKAFNYLETAIELGQNWVRAWQDDDLAWLRDDPRFIEIVGPPPEEE